MNKTAAKHKSKTSSTKPKRTKKYLNIDTLPDVMEVKNILGIGINQC